MMSLFANRSSTFSSLTDYPQTRGHSFLYSLICVFELPDSLFLKVTVSLCNDCICLQYRCDNKVPEFLKKENILLLKQEPRAHVNTFYVYLCVCVCVCVAPLAPSFKELLALFWSLIARRQCGVMQRTPQRDLWPAI